jgi:hypothetical protein
MAWSAFERSAMADRIVAASPSTMARLAGALYGISAVPAGFSVYVLLKLVVRNDPAATASNILGAVGLFRLGFVADLVGILFFVAAMLFLYELFKPVSRSPALLMLIFSLIGAAIQALDSVGDLAALLLVKGGTSLTALPTAQAQALAFLSLRLHTLTYDLALVFFGPSSVLMGYLILRSTFLPRIFGVLMAIDGLGYLTFSLATFLSPPSAAHLYPYLPFVTAFLGEPPLMLWLIIKGVNVARWEEQAAAGVALPTPTG